MKILIAEDQEKLALSIKKGLEHNGYAVDVVYDGGQALRRMEYENQSYDLLILDIMLPTTDGITICKTLRQRQVSTPILMLTAKDTIDDRVTGLDVGADDYLVKPFAFEELLARIRALLRRPTETTVAEFSQNGITLNTVTKIVTRNNKEIELTIKEFSILEQFLRHPNEVLSRDKIMSHVWDFAFEGFSNVVDSHVKNLRKKLQKKNETLFETVHGVGYRFKA
jgi:DNA-binding response OmpR family regulator